MSTIVLPNQSEICSRCKNYGYYEVGLIDKVEKMQMFCACGVGRNLRKLSIEWRLTDLNVLSDNMLPRLKVIKANLDDKEKVTNYLNVLIADFEEIIEKIKEELKK